MQPLPDTRQDLSRAIACCERVAPALNDTDRKIIVRLHADLHDELKRKENENG